MSLVAPTRLNPITYAGESFELLMLVREERVDETARENNLDENLTELTRRIHVGYIKRDMQLL